MTEPWKIVADTFDAHHDVMATKAGMLELSCSCGHPFGQAEREPVAWTALWVEHKDDFRRHRAQAVLDALEQETSADLPQYAVPLAPGETRHRTPLLTDLEAKAKAWWASTGGCLTGYEHDLGEAIEALSAEMRSGHPENYCHRCGGPNVLSWFAPSPLWNAVMRGGSIGGDEPHDGIVCPVCFAVIARERGVATRWRFSAVDVQVPLETVTPSGRIWDETTDLWREVSTDD